MLLPLLAAAILAGLVWLAGADRAIGQTVFLIGPPLNLHSGQRLGQTFSVPADGLHRIDLMFVSYREIREGTVRLRLFDEAGTMLTSQEVDTSGFRDAWNSIEFPALTGVAGRVIRLELRRNSSWRSPVGLRVGPGAAYPAGSGLLDNKPDNSFDLAFRAYLATPPTLSARLARVVELAHTLTAARPGLFGQPAFPLALGAIYAAGLAALVCLVASFARWR